MIRLALVIASALVASSAVAQTTGSCETGTARAVLDASDVEASLANTGVLFSDGLPPFQDGYLVPKQEGVSPFAVTSLWIAGTVDGQLRASYARDSGHQMWPGPLDEGATLPNPTDCSAYDRIWVVSSRDLEAYQRTGVASSDLAEWPVGLGAPAVDASGQPVVVTHREQILELANGEQPVISGTQTAFWVMNDVGNTHRSGEGNDGPQLGVEVAVTAFVVNSTDDALHQGTFYRYKVTNRNTTPILDTHIGFFAVPYLGEPRDDYVGVDTTRGLAFVYNALNADSYYATPPAIGIDLLDSLYAFRAPKRGGDHVHATPHYMPEVIYNSLRGRFDHGELIREGGAGYSFTGTPTRYSFAGDPVTETYWSQVNTDEQGLDAPLEARWMVVGSPPIDLSPGASHTLTVAILFGQGEDHLDSITELRAASDRVQAAYDDGSLFEMTPPGPPPLEPPVLRSPATGGIVAQERVDFEWTASPDAWTYRVQIRNTAGRLRLETFDAIEPTASIRIPDAFVGPAPTELAWRVQAVNGAQESPYTPWRTVTYYRYVGHMLRLQNGTPAYVEVESPGGDPCGPTASSTLGCSEVFGNPVYLSLNSTRTYYVGEAKGLAPGSDETLGAFAPHSFEIRFTEAGGLGVYRDQGGHIIRVPFEVWDVGPTQPGDTNNPTDDVRLIPVLYADESGGEAGTTCRFDPDEIVEDETAQGRYVESDRLSANVPASTYAAFAARYEPLVEGAENKCYIDSDLTFEPYLTDARPIQNLVFGSRSDNPMLPQTGTVIRMFTTVPFVVANDGTPQSGDLTLGPAYPNPAASSLTVPYRIASPSAVELRVYDVLGREVATLVNSRQPEGAHTAELDASALAPGVYVVRLRAGDETRTTRITVVR